LLMLLLLMLMLSLLIFLVCIVFQAKKIFVFDPALQKGLLYKFSSFSSFSIFITLCQFLAHFVNF
jgi:hypothetical protein